MEMNSGVLRNLIFATTIGQMTGVTETPRSKTLFVAQKLGYQSEGGFARECSAGSTMMGTLRWIDDDGVGETFVVAIS